MRVISALSVILFFCFVVAAQSGKTPLSGFVTLPVQVVIAVDRSGSMDANDPRDMRCQAAHQFIEEIRGRSPDSFVGIVLFSENCSIRSKKPAVIGDSIQYDSIWNSIEFGANKPTNFRYPPVLTKSLATYQGRAFTTALNWLDTLNNKVPGVKQHIVMITDDGWYESGDANPDYLILTFKSRFPQGELPKIHTVVITGNGNPAQQGTRGLENIKAIADSTGGMYIENATPQTIVKTLSSILETISIRVDIQQGYRSVLSSRGVTIRNHSVYSLLGGKVTFRERTLVNTVNGVYIVKNNAEYSKRVKRTGKERVNCSPK